MKVTKPICIDDDLIKELKNINASSLVNSLIREYFEGIDTKNLSKLKQMYSEKQAKKRVLLKEMRDLSKKIKEISEKERKLLKVTRGLTEKEYEILKNCQSRVSLSLAYRQPPLKNRSWVDVKQIWQELKGGVS